MRLSPGTLPYPLALLPHSLPEGPGNNLYTAWKLSSVVERLPTVYQILRGKTPNLIYTLGIKQAFNYLDEGNIYPVFFSVINIKNFLLIV